MSPAKVMVVGTGLTGAVASYLLVEAGHTPIMWENSAGTGGRMATKRANEIPGCTADLGSTFLHSYPEGCARYKRYHDDLKEHGLIMETVGDFENDLYKENTIISRFMTPLGSNSIVKHYIQKSGVTPSFKTRLTKIELEGGKWVLTAMNGMQETVDALILTMPIFHMYTIEGYLQNILGILAAKPDLKKQLDKVVYVPRFTILLFYQPGTEIAITWAAKFFDDPCIRVVSADHIKRGLDSSVGPSFTVQSTATIARQLIESNKDLVCEKVIMPRLHALIPELPPPHEVVYHKWRYSQVVRPFEDKPGAILIHQDPPLVLAGDAFSESTMNGCFESAERALEELKPHINYM